MTTKQIADKFYAYMNQGAFEKIYSELYSQDATSEESPGSDWKKAHGMKEIHEKGKLWNDTVKEMHGGTTAAPIIAGSYFTCYMTMDFTDKQGKRINMEELGVYRVKDGKIVSEQLFY